MKQFYLSRLNLTNYRKFTDKEFLLNKQMNVFIGRNSSGKTTVLEAANVLLGAYLAAFKKYVPSRFVYNISKSDVLLKAKANNVDKTVFAADGIPQYPCVIGCTMLWDNRQIEYQRMVEKADGRTKFNGNNPMQAEISEWEKRIAAADNTDECFIFPLVLYLSSARLWNENQVSNISEIPTRLEAYQRCLDDKRGTELAFKYIQLLKSISFEENKGIPYPAYEVLLQAVTYSLEEELPQGTQVIFSSRYKGIAIKQDDGTVMPFDALSDGYRNVIKIVLDIAVRMCILNPSLKERALSETPGVVIIDELDLSLHPTWQKRIVRILKRLFPKVQFICATHSPFIIQSLEEGELFSLEEEIQEEYSGKSIEDIAEEIMGVSIPQYSEKKEKMYEAAEAYFKALENSESADDLVKLKEKLDELSARYSDNPAYYAFLAQKYLVKKAECDEDATDK